MVTLNNDKFAYSAEPQSIKVSKRSKYRDDQADSKLPMNIMSDSRIVRGNTALRDSLTMKSKLAMKNRVTTSSSIEQNTESRPYYQFNYRCVPGDNFNLESYLVERESNTNNIITTEQKTQTDIFAAKPLAPRYVPRKTGVDTATQVEDTSELFDFDQEVAPIVQTLVMKTIEQAVYEVNCEAELEELGRLQVVYSNFKAGHQQWIQDELQKTIAEREAKVAIVEENRIKSLHMTNLRSLIAGQQFAQQIYPGMISSIFKELADLEVWQDESKLVISNEIMPSLVSRVELVEEFLNSSKIIIDEILAEAMLSYDQRIPSVVEFEASSILLTIRLERVIDHDNSNDDDEGVKPIKTENIAIGPICLNKRSTIQDITKDLNMIREAKNYSNINPIEESRIKAYFDKQLGRDVAIDAVLSNFPLPKDLFIDL